MARVPRIDSPCPLPAGARPVNGGHCSHCNITVHCLDGQDSAARETLLASATGPLCVSYRVRTRIAIAATLVTASAAAFAGDPLLPERTESPVERSATLAGATSGGNGIPDSNGTDAATALAEFENGEQFLGGVTRPADATWIDDESEEASVLDRIVMVGGITRPGDVVWHDDADIATLPVVSANDADTALDAEPDVR